jgi:hypothetical protein
MANIGVVISIFNHNSVFVLNVKMVYYHRIMKDAVNILTYLNLEYKPHPSNI